MIGAALVALFIPGVAIADGHVELFRRLVVGLTEHGGGVGATVRLHKGLSQRDTGAAAPGLIDIETDRILFAKVENAGHPLQSAVVVRLDLNFIDEAVVTRPARPKLQILEREHGDLGWVKTQSGDLARIIDQGSEVRAAARADRHAVGWIIRAGERPAVTIGCLRATFTRKGCTIFDLQPVHWLEDKFGTDRVGSKVHHPGDIDAGIEGRMVTGREGGRLFAILNGDIARAVVFIALERHQPADPVVRLVVSAHAARPAIGRRVVVALADGVVDALVGVRNAIGRNAADWPGQVKLVLHLLDVAVLLFAAERKADRQHIVDRLIVEEANGAMIVVAKFAFSEKG